MFDETTRFGADNRARVARANETGTRAVHGLRPALADVQKPFGLQGSVQSAKPIHKAMFRKTGGMNQGPYDWSADVARIASPTLLVFADAGMMPPEHIVEFYKLLGGGTRDAGLDGSRRPTPNQLAIIPGTTPYDLMLTATRGATDYANAFLARKKGD